MGMVMATTGGKPAPKSVPTPKTPGKKAAAKKKATGPIRREGGFRENAVCLGDDLDMVE